MDTFEKIKAMIIDTLGCEPDEISAGASLSDDLGADSLAAVELIMALEDEFDIVIPEDASKNIKTVGDLVELVGALA